MAATPTDVRELSLTCEFDKYSDAQLQPFLDEAATHVNEQAWNVDPNNLRFDRGHALLAAHLLTLEIRGGGRSTVKGTITSERLGPAARSYAAPTANLGGVEALRLDQTTYGMRYLAMLDSLPLTPTSLFGGCT
jgi:hypothetical protein